MADVSENDRDADRSSIEIKTLVRKLHPKRTNHKDRIRSLNKFRNYVLGGRGKAPEFYDDDLPLLWLGASAPASTLEEVNDDLLAMGIYGVLQACGTPSEDHDGTLKRSARHAMKFLKWLVLDWKEDSNAKKGDLNLFAKSFLSLETKDYHHMQLDLHCIGDDRGGAYEEACQLIVLILTRHMKEVDDDNGDSTFKEQAVMVEELITSAKAQQEFELFVARHCTVSEQDTIKKNAVKREQELAFQQRQDALANKAAGVPISGAAASEDFLVDDSDNNPDTSDVNADDPDATEESDFDEEDDVVAAMRKRGRKLRKGDGRESSVRAGVATRWEDCQLAREQAARAASAARAGQHDSVRDSQRAARESLERQEAKATVLGKDPLGIVVEDDFDLSEIEKRQAEQMERSLAELQENLHKADSTGNEKLIKKLSGQKESLEAFIERLGGIEAMENLTNLQRSILPTNPKFDPLLFLTIVHRKTKFDKLTGSMTKLSSKTDNQVEQLQNLVRDNFPLFVRCAEGFEAFRKSSEEEVGLGFNERIEKLEGISESCSFQAKKSFKPLLDNTSEVRKVQSAMSVLQRVAPILQVPALMRQHIENRRYSQALKTYRRVLVVDKTNKIELLNHVKIQAEVCVVEARRALESRLAQDSVTVEELLEGIRDLDELLQLTELPASQGSEGKEKEAKEENDNESDQDRGIFDIGGTVINIRDHPPALACLLLQAAHMSNGAKKIIEEADGTSQRIFAGESLLQVQSDPVRRRSSSDSVASGGAEETPETNNSQPSQPRNLGNQWKYDVLDSRVLSTIKAVDFARLWLPRLLIVGKAAREDEKRRAVRVGSRQRLANVLNPEDNQLTAFEVLLSNIAPSVTRLAEHAAFCSLGSIGRTGKEIVMTFGMDAPDKLRALLRSPLPPSQSTKVAKELADLVQILAESASGATALRPNRDSTVFQLSPLDECKALTDAAVLTIEKRRCIYAFDVCSRACSNKASGSGKFDADTLLNCLHTLAEQLSRPGDCAAEIEKGCELVVRRCCEGLASYVRDRGDDARLGAVAECADVIDDRIGDIVTEAEALTDNVGALEEKIMDDIAGLESAMFDEYLENIRQDVASSVRVGWLDTDADSALADGNPSATPAFPAYLSASLLAIVRCRAQVEQALGNKVRRSEGVLYQHLSMATVAEGVIEGICNEILARKQKLKVRQADRLANELEFLKTTLQKFLGDETISLLDSTLHVVASRAGRGRDYSGDGPDGLAALEELERLGRVYVLCLAESQTSSTM